MLKLGGLIVDRREVLHGKIDQMSRDEVEKRLAQLIGSRELENKSGAVIEDKTASKISLDQILKSEKKEKVSKD